MRSSSQRFSRESTDGALRIIERTSLEVESADAATMTCGRGATSAESNALYFGPAGARNVQRTLHRTQKSSSNIPRRGDASID